MYPYFHIHVDALYNAALLSVCIVHRFTAGFQASTGIFFFLRKNRDHQVLNEAVQVVRQLLFISVYELAGDYYFATWRLLRRFGGNCCNESGERSLRVPPTLRQDGGKFSSFFFFYWFVSKTNNILHFIQISQREI